MLTDTVANANGVYSPDEIHPGDLFKLSDAEKILGEPAHLIDSTSKKVVRMLSILTVCQ